MNQELDLLGNPIKTAKAPQKPKEEPKARPQAEEWRATGPKFTVIRENRTTVWILNKP